MGLDFSLLESEFTWARIKSRLIYGNGLELEWPAWTHGYHKTDTYRNAYLYSKEYRYNYFSAPWEGPAIHDTPVETSMVNPQILVSDAIL